MKQKIGFTKHGYERFIERYKPKSKKQAEDILKNIYRNGKRVNEFSEKQKRIINAKLRNPWYRFDTGRIVLDKECIFIFAQDARLKTVLYAPEK